MGGALARAGGLSGWQRRSRRVYPGRQAGTTSTSGGRSWAAPTTTTEHARPALPPSPLEGAAGIKRFTAVEDLTVVCYKKLREMNDCVDIDKVWSVEGKLRYTLTGDSTVRKVKSVFDSLQVITNRG